MNKNDRERVKKNASKDPVSPSSPARTSEIITTTGARKAMSDALVMIDREWRYSYITSSNGKLFGRDHGDLIGKNFWDELPPHANHAFRKDFMKAMNDHIYVSMEEYFPPLETWFDIRVWPAENGLTIFINDITDIKKADEALRKSEEKFRYLIEQAVDGIFQGDPAGNFISVNPRGAEMTGYSMEELLTMNMGQLFSEEEKVRTPLRYDLLKEGHVVTNERMMTRKDGTLVAIEMHTKMMPDKTYQSFFRDVTARKKAEEQIKVSELYYRTIFENTGTATVMLDEDATISLANSKFEKLSGYSKAEIENKKRWTDFPHPEDLEFMKERHQLRRSNAVDVPHEYEFRFIDKGGNIKNILLTIDMIPGTNKSVASLLDITERKVAENRLRESERLYRQLFENNPAPNIIYEKGSLNIVAVNEAFRKHYGYRPEQIQSMVLTDLYPAEQIPALAQQANSIRGHQYAGEWKNIKADGSIIETMAVSHDIMLEGKDCRIAVINDITEIKRVESELRDSEEKYRTVIECASDGIAILKDGMVQYVNQSLINITGYRTEEIVGKSFLGFVADEDIELVRKNYEARLRGEQTPVGYEIRGVTRNGNSITVEVTNTVLDLKDGQAELIFLHDISERKMIENRIRQINEELEERVQTRTKQLAQLNKELEKLNTTKDKLFSIIAHDLKSPIAVIISSAEMLLRTLADHPEDQERLKRYSENILRGTQEGYKLLENLLEWATTQTGQISFEPQNLDLKESIHECVKGMKLLLFNKNLKVIEPEQSHFVFADKNMVDVILRNLISNAIKYSFEGGSIVIRLNRNEHRLITEIEDSGMGMSEESRVRLFRIENKNSTPGTANERGTGLGLILCKEFISKLGGSIWVESEVGKGSTFKFSLPLAAINS